MENKQIKLKILGHHQSHASNAFFTSNYKDSLIITIDDFMDHEDCDAIVEFTKRKLERSKVVNYGEGDRNKIDKLFIRDFTDEELDEYEKTLR